MNNNFVNEYIEEHDNDTYARFLSFDICHDFFVSCKGKASSIDNSRDSILVLWGYLGSWGMLRGRSVLHNVNPYYLRNAIKVIDKYAALFDVDVEDYGKCGEAIIACYNDLYQSLRLNEHNPTATLITKIMFGVYSCIPAVDKNVSEFMSQIIGVHPKSINTIMKVTKLCFDKNKELFCGREITTIDWNGKQYKRIFNSARLIDIYAYVEGRKAIENKNPNKK